MGAAAGPEDACAGRQKVQLGGGRWAWCDSSLLPRRLGTQSEGEFGNPAAEAFRGRAILAGGESGLSSLLSASAIAPI